MSGLNDKLLALLSGHAAGILTEAEREELMAAALQDQAVFDALADEEALRALLAEEGPRARLAALLAPTTATRAQRSWWRRPWTWAAAALPALAGVALLVLSPSLRQPEPERMAQAKTVSREDAPQRPLPLPEEPKIVARQSPAAIPTPPAAPAPTPELRAFNATGLSAPPATPSTPPLIEPPPLQERKTNELPAAAPELPRPAAFASSPGNVVLAEAQINAPARFAVEILTRIDPTSVWTPVEADTIAAGAPLRLRIRTDRGGVLRVRPSRDQQITLNGPTDGYELDLDPAAPGRLDVTVQFYPGDLAKQEAAGRLRRRALADEARPALPVTVTRRLTVR